MPHVISCNVRFFTIAVATLMACIDVYVLCYLQSSRNANSSLCECIVIDACSVIARMKVMLVKGKKWRGLYDEGSTMQRQGKGNFPISFLHSWRNGNWHACICFHANTISRAARRDVLFDKTAVTH